ncbi:MAG: hypothetical protein AB2L11_03400 [Syntrophobacteraceae bacterium]
MAKSGRFGKYGDFKRKEKLRENRLMLREHRRNPRPAGWAERQRNRSGAAKDMKHGDT